MTNKFGLSRNIPEAIKRSVRQHCGFGCAICGATITEYEHFFPDFADAQEHNSERIILLCPTHHGMVTKGIIPKTKIQEVYYQPAARMAGFSKQDHPWFEGIPALKIGGGSIVQNTSIPIQIKGENVIEFKAPEDGSNVTRISAIIRDASGDSILEIHENEWRVLSGCWDFRSVKNRYIFSDSSGTPNLVIKMQAPALITVELLKTSINGMPIEITEEKMMIGSNTLSDCIFSNCKIGISIN